MALHVHQAHKLLKKAYADSFNLPDIVKDKQGNYVDAGWVEKAQKHKLCVRIANVRDGVAEFRADQKQGWYERVNPFVGGGQRWALPYAAVICESGAGSGSSNYYGLLQGWGEWNYGLGPVPADAGSAPKLLQDIAAHRGREIYHGMWECPAY